MSCLYVEESIYIEREHIPLPTLTIPILLLSQCCYVARHLWIPIPIFCFMLIKATHVKVFPLQSLSLNQKNCFWPYKFF